MAESNDKHTEAARDSTRPKATRIDEQSTFYTRIIPLMLLALGVITILLFLAAIGVLAGIL